MFRAKSGRQIPKRVSSLDSIRKFLMQSLPEIKPDILDARRQDANSFRSV